MPCSFSFANGHSQKMNKKVCYTHQYLSRTESLFLIILIFGLFFFDEEQRYHNGEASGQHNGKPDTV